MNIIDSEVLNAAAQSQVKAQTCIEDFKLKWRDVSLPDLLHLWGERNKQVEANKDILRDCRKELKIALKDFSATEESKTEKSVALVKLFKSSFDQVVSASKFAEQNFQSAFMILSNVSDPIAVVDATHSLLTHMQSLQTLLQTKLEQVHVDDGNSTARLEDDMLSLRDQIFQLRAQLETSERAKLDLVQRSEADLARKDQELETLLETMRRTQPQTKLINKHELEQALDLQKQGEAERKLASVRAELVAAEEKYNHHIEQMEADLVSEKERCVSLQKILWQNESSTKVLETELRTLKEQHSALHASTRLDWIGFTERVIGFLPEGRNKLHDMQSTEKALSSQFRKLENELVTCRLKEQEAQAAAKEAILNADRSSSTMLSDVAISNQDAVYSGMKEGSDKDMLMAVIMQRNKLQEEVVRLNVLHASQLQSHHRSEYGMNFRRTPYDVEATHEDIAPDYLDDKSSKAFHQMNVLEQLLVKGCKMGLHDFWSRHALLTYLALIHIFALCYAVHDLNPEIVSEVDRALPTEWK